MRLASVLAALSALLLALPVRAEELVLEVLDVGQGDALLLTSPTGKRVLVDGGPPDAGMTLAAALRERGIDALDLLVITHPHLDHVGGLIDAVRVAPPRLVLDPGTDHPLKAYDRLLEELERRKIPLRTAHAGRSIELGGGARAEVLGPPADRLRGTRSDVNSNSVVLRVTYGAVVLLLVGDAEADTERMLLESERAGLATTVLKVAHHGSRHSSTPAFLAATRPQVAVISAGAGNDYGHPTPETLRRLERIGARVLRTDLDGTIRIGTDGKLVRVRASRGASFEVVAKGAPVVPVESFESGPEREERSDAAAPAPVLIPSVGLPGPPLQGDVYAASARSKAYHRTDCEAVSRIKPGNLRRYTSVAQAEQDGKRPAQDCLGAGGGARKERRR